VYGTAQSPTEVDSPLPTRTPRQRQPGQPVYSDLLSPAPTQSSPSPQQRQTSPTAAAVWPAASGADHQQQAPRQAPETSPAPTTAYAAAPYAAAADHQMAAGASSSPTSPAGAPPEPAGTATAVAPGAPVESPAPSAAPAPGDTDESRSAPPIGIIVSAVLAGAALLVVIALSIPLLLQYLQADPSPPYAVGECVVQDGQQPRGVECGPGAYEIVLEVDDVTDCPGFPAEPAITVSDPSTVFCLSPIETAGVTE
jgi:hypothetical protein